MLHNTVLPCARDSINTGQIIQREVIEMGLCLIVVNCNIKTIFMFLKITY